MNTKEKIYQIVLLSLDTCTRMTKASKEDEARRVTDDICKIKDNPVPQTRNSKGVETDNGKPYVRRPRKCKCGKYH